MRIGAESGKEGATLLRCYSPVRSSTALPRAADPEIDYYSRIMHGACAQESSRVERKAMAQIADVVQVSAVLETAQQELGILFCGTEFRGTLELLDRILEVLWEAERRWLRCRSRSREEKDRRSIRGEVGRRSYKDWLMSVKKAADDMRAMALHERMRVLEGRKKKTSKARMLPSLHRSSSDIWELEAHRRRLQDLWREYESFEYAAAGGLPLARGEVDENSSSSIDDDVLAVPVGRDGDKQSIIHLLTEAEAKAEAKNVVLPIVGLPGVGKTTLARLVFHHPRFQDYAKAWVDLSSLPLPRQKDLLLKTIATAVISQVLASSGAEDESCLQELNDIEGFMSRNRLAQLLRAAGNKKLLLVLDDLLVCPLEGLVINIIKDLERWLCVGTNLVVIVTTDSRCVARHMASVAKPYDLHPLSDDMCWAIIKRTSGFRKRVATSNQEEEEEAAKTTDKRGQEIASKCGGLPSVAQALGRIFQSVNPQKWPDICNNIIRVDYNASRGEDSPSIHSVSAFSHLRRVNQCLSFLGRISLALCAFIFPKGSGRRIIKRDVINHLDVLFPNDFYSVILRILLDTSFLLGEKSTPTANEEADEDTMFLTMNDLVHNFATDVLSGLMIVVDGTNNGAKSSHGGNSSNAYFALVCNLESAQLNLSSMLPAGIIALRFEGCSKMELSDYVFSSCPKYLLVLDLSGCSVKKLPSSIGQLKQLTYLNAPEIQDLVLPLSITGLTWLKYLSLHGSSQLSDLPDAFGNLRRLHHLDLSGCSGLNALPESFEEITHLKHLDLSGCSGLHALPKMMSTSSLAHLDLSGCSCLVGVTEALRGCRKLEYLNLSHRCGYVVEDWYHLKGLDGILPKLKELRFLGLSACLDPFFYTMQEAESLKYVEKCITCLANLEHLELSQNKFLLDLPERIDNLKKLHTLNLSGCFRLQRLPCTIVKLKELRTLALSGCPKLKLLPKNIEQLAELPFLQRGELPSSITDLIVSYEKRIIAGVDQSQDMTTTSIDAANQLPMDSSFSAEPDTTEIVKNQ